jgi:hypothetical protein
MDPHGCLHGRTLELAVNFAMRQCVLRHIANDKTIDRERAAQHVAAMGNFGAHENYDRAGARVAVPPHCRAVAPVLARRLRWWSGTGSVSECTRTHTAAHTRRVP